MGAEAISPIRELDHRISDGIDVRMLWNEQDGSVIVAVVDRRNREGFCIDVLAGEHPRDVFHHPYAYAAHRGIVPAPETADVDEWIVQPA